MAEKSVYTYRVEPQEVDFTLCATVSALGSAVLNTAGLDAHRKGFGVDALNRQNHSWVLSRMAFELDRRPGQYTDYRIATWISDYGRVLSTRNFTLADAAGERTFEAAAFLRRCGADTTEVKKLLQNDMEHTVARYKILQSAQLYRGNIAVAVPQTPQDRVVVAQAADELLNISGVEVSFVVCPTEDGANISARSIGDMNAQMIMEKLGGGGNRSAAAAQLHDTTLRDAVNSLFAAIDEYLDG